jgi:hypothetical protein
MNRGYIKLWRCSSDNEMYFREPFTMWQAWMDLVMLASYKEKSVIIKKQSINLKIGQLCWSEIALAARWKWGRTRLRSFLKLLKTEHQIEQQKNNVTSLITIINYKEYQQTEQQPIQQPNSNRTATEQQPNTNKESIRNKEVKNKDIKPFPIPDDFGISESVKSWAEKSGHDRLEERLDHFKDWALASGKKYLDWDATFRNAIRNDWAKLAGTKPPIAKKPVETIPCNWDGYAVWGLVDPEKEKADA